MDFKVKLPKTEYFGELEDGTFFLFNNEIYLKACLDIGFDNTNAVRLTQGTKRIFVDAEIVYPLVLNGDFSMILE